MSENTFLGVKVLIGVLATLGLYSVLYRENKFYRFWEHVFLGLAGGWALFSLWAESIKPDWYDPMVGRTAVEGGGTGTPGYWAWAILLPIGLMGYMVFSRKHSWISRIPIGIILGIWSGQQLQNYWRTYGPQFQSSILPVWPTNTSSFTVPNTLTMTPEQQAVVAQSVYPSQAIGNIISVLTVLCVLSYFIFSIDLRGKFLGGATKMGRYLLMIGFGAIFGSTVMMRFTLLIDRMYFIWFEMPEKVRLMMGG